MAFPGTDPSKLKQAEEAWWRDRVQAVFHGISFPSFNHFFEELYTFFNGKGMEGEASWSLFPETMEVLETLFRLKYPLGMISNFDSRLGSVLTALGIDHFFQTVISSGEEGVAKPSREIFERALKKAGCTASQALYIGDHPINDIEGAKGAGIPALLIDRDKKETASGEKQRTRVISDLREIRGYL